MSPRWILALFLVYVLTDQAYSGLIVCKKLHEHCAPVPLSCCPGMTCKFHGQGDGFRCVQGNGVFGRCYRRGQLCQPDVGNSPCCEGLFCKPRALNPSIHECGSLL